MIRNVIRYGIGFNSRFIRRKKMHCACLGVPAMRPHRGALVGGVLAEQGGHLRQSHAR